MRINDTAEAEYTRRKEALRQKFLVVMQERYDTLSKAVAAIRGGQGPSHIQDCRLVAHKTAGTAGAFGYEALGRTARTTCDALDAIGDEASWEDAIRFVEHFQFEIRTLLQSEAAKQEA